MTTIKTMWQVALWAWTRTGTTLKSSRSAFCHVLSAVSVIINIAPAFVVTNSDPDPMQKKENIYV